MQATLSPVLVGIDLAKDSFTVAVGHQGHEVLHAFPLDQAGLTSFSQFLGRFGSFPQDFFFGLEASGPYTNLLLNWLRARQARTSLLNPLQLYRFRRAQSLRCTKTDAIDARLTLRYMTQNYQDLQPCPADDDLQVLANAYQEVTRQVARLKTQIRQQVHTLFPELAGTSTLFSRRVLAVLLHFPSAHALAHAKPTNLAHIWASACPASGRPLALTCEKLQELARASIAPRAPQRESVLRSAIRQLLMLLEEQKTLRRALLAAVRSAYPDTWRVLNSIPGLGPVTIALFLARVRSLDRFPGHRQLAAYAGIDPTTYESGQYKAKGHLSKRGDPSLRSVLYLMAQGVIRRTTTFRLYFDQLTARGKAYRVAIIACAHKLLRVIFALARSLTEFRDLPAEEVSHS